MKCPLDGFPMDVDTDWLGRTVVRCVGCERRAAHRCVDCGKPVEGRAWRCAVHLKAKKLIDTRVHHERHRAERNIAQRKRWRESARRREKHSAASKAWRERNQVEYKRKRFGRKHSGYTTREKYIAYQRAYNAKRREKKRLAMRARYYRLNPERPKPTCTECGVALAYLSGHPPKWCDAHRPFTYRRKAA